MKKEVEDFLKEIVNDDNIFFKYKNTAKNLLREDFKEEVLAVFKYDIRSIAEGNFDVPKTVCAFIRYAYCLESQKLFLDSNFGRINEIYEIVIAEIKKMKEEEK